MSEEPSKNSNKSNQIKRIISWILLAFIVLWIIATFVIAVSSFPNKENLLRIFIMGCFVFPFFSWIFLWAYGALTGKKNVASFRSKETDDIIRQAEKIKEAQNARETGTEPENTESE